MTFQRKINDARAQFSLNSLGISVFSALLLYLLEITFVISFTALIYSGELTSQVPQALGFIILGDAILCLVVGLLSSTSGMIAIEQDAPGVMFSVAAAGVIAALSGEAHAQFATVTLMIVFTTTTTGLMLLFLGAFKLSGITRFLPYPIIGGFLAGSGWLLVQGAIGLMTDSSLSQAWLTWELVRLWLPGVVLGIVIYLATKKIDKPYTIPAVMLLAGVLFYGITWFGSSSLEELRTQGWLLNASLSGTTWQFPLNATLLSQVDWEVLVRQIPALLPVALISVIGLLLNASGLELIIKKDINLDQELVTAGFGNLAAGLTGGLMGFQDISFSSLNHTLSGGKRLVSLFLACFLAATLFFGNSMILYIPKFILGSALVLLGFELLFEWVYEAWAKFPRIDFLVIVIILLVIAASGFLQGILVGLVMTVIMFVVSYSRISAVKNAFNAQEVHSRVTRIPQERQILDTYGAQVYIMKLEGFIFFGTANGIFVRVREQITDNSTTCAKYIVMDFAKVTGIDSTGMLSFSRMVQWSQEYAITLVFTGLAGRTKAQVLREPTLNEEHVVKFFADLDHGLEWCENAIILHYLPDPPEAVDLTHQLMAILKDEQVKRLLPYLQRQEYQPGEYLMKEGDAPDFIYFIESGLVTAQLEPPDKPPVRLETMRGGRTVGELGFYLGTRRTANVIADQPSTVYTLSTTALKHMETADPEAASLLHRITVQLLSERVTHLTRAVGALERS